MTRRGLAARSALATAAVLLVAFDLVGCQSAVHSSVPTPSSGATASASVRVASVAASTPFGPVGSAASATSGSSPTPGQTYSIVALGDSVPAGTNCGCDPFPTLIANQLTDADVHVNLLNVSHEGWTMTNVASQLDDQPSVRAAVQHANLVLLTIGANDLTNLADEGPNSCDIDCIHAGVDEHLPALGDLVNKLNSLDTTPNRRIAWTTYWNVFADGDQGRSANGDAYVDWSDQVTQYANSAYAQEVTAHKGSVVDTYAPFKGANGVVDPTTLLASDGDHPNAAGHELIAKVIIQTLGLG